MLQFPCTALKFHKLTFIFSSFADTNNPFVEMHSDIPKIINMAVGREMIIPCRVTDPNITVTLKKVPLSKHALKALLWMMFLFVCLQLCNAFEIFLQFNISYAMFLGVNVFRNISTLGASF